MLLSDYDYYLPSELVALYPPKDRGDSRLLLSCNGTISDRKFADIVNLLDDRYFLILNDTKVLPARLWGETERGGKREVLYISKEGENAFRALSRGKLRQGALLRVGRYRLTARERDGEGLTLFETDAPVERILEECGHIPLPPYIKRADELADRDRYQTVYSRREASVAAPTAGLHFTAGILERLKEKGIRQIFVTLEVGMGTFKPIKTAHIEDHHMHSERYRISEEAAEAINDLQAEGKLPICVGTTSVRAVESAFKEGRVRAGCGFTDLFITPGFKFGVTKGLITNFHLPGSTLMLLVAALTGAEELKHLYAHAVEKRYRFYSYGDAMLWLSGGGFASLSSC